MVGTVKKKNLAAAVDAVMELCKHGLITSVEAMEFLKHPHLLLSVKSKLDPNEIMKKLLVSES